MNQDNIDDGQPLDAEGPGEDDLRELGDEESARLACPKCGAEIYEDADRCPSCGQFVKPEHGKASRLAAWLMAAVIILIVLAMIWAMIRA